MNHESTCTETWTLADGTVLKLRHIKPGDAALEQAFVRELSDRTKYFRFNSTINALSKRQLDYLTNPDPHTAAALIVLHNDGDNEEEITVARYAIDPDGTACQFAIVVADDWQRRGIGMRLMHALIRHARSDGIKRMYDTTFESNVGMRGLAQRLGFDESKCRDDPESVVIAKAL